jgi:hypothetical protein
MKVLQTFWELTNSVSNSELCYTQRGVGHLVISFGVSKLPALSEDVEEASSQKVGKPSHPDAAVCPSKIH